MSQAAVGQRSAHRPQCTQTSSSLTMTRPVCFSGAETYKAWVTFFAGASHGQRMDEADFAALVEPLGRPLRQRTTLYEPVGPAASLV